MKTIEFKSDIIAVHWLFNFSNSPKERAKMRKDIFIELLAENKRVKLSRPSIFYLLQMLFVRDHDGLDVNYPAWANIFMLCLQLVMLL